MTPVTASNAAARGLANIPPTLAEVGSGELNKADSWDDFPNGRWGDFKSPAFGAQGLWGNNDSIVGPLTPLNTICYAHNSIEPGNPFGVG